MQDLQTLLTGTRRPTSGDIVLAAVQEVGQHKRLELTDGRRAHLFPGDEILVCYGNRYAPDQFEAIVGDDLSPCDLVAAGGIASHEMARHDRMEAPTHLVPIGLIGDAKGTPLNLKNYPIRSNRPAGPISVVLVAGTSMNAGKTVTAASLVRGLKAVGHRVAGIKATGTGAGGDLWMVRDIGADVVIDFVDAGLPSTYMVEPEVVEAATLQLINYAAQQGCEYAVVEIADGLQQQETAALLNSERLRNASLGVVFASYDAMGAKAGVDWLLKAGHQVLAVSGRLTRSVLAMREAWHATGLPVLTPMELVSGSLAKIMPGGLTMRVPAEMPAPVVVPRPAPKMSWVNAVPAPCNHSREALGQRTIRASGYGTHTAPSNGEMSSVNGSRQVPGAVATASGRQKDGRPRDDCTDISGAIMAFIAERLMDKAIDALCGARWGERSAERRNFRNGFRYRRWTIGSGEICLKIPRPRRGGYAPAFVEPRGWAETALFAVHEEAVGPGVSMPSMSMLVLAMGIAGMSLDSVAALCGEIDHQVSQLRSYNTDNPAYSGRREPPCSTFDLVDPSDLSFELADPSELLFDWILHNDAEDEADEAEEAAVEAMTTDIWGRGGMLAVQLVTDDRAIQGAPRPLNGSTASLQRTTSVPIPATARNGRKRLSASEPPFGS